MQILTAKSNKKYIEMSSETKKTHKISLRTHLHSRTYNHIKQNSESTNEQDVTFSIGPP